MQDNIKYNIYSTIIKSEYFKKRREQILCFFDDHFSRRYHTTPLLAFSILDGVINDFTKDKGLFAEKTDLQVWDCIVGSSGGLGEIIKLFNKSRKKTNEHAIYIPYRNGILHGRDINYANEFVSCKCVALMFAVADWINKKSSEIERRGNYEKSKERISGYDFISNYKQIQELEKEIKNWTPQNIEVGKDIPAKGNLKDYDKFPYVKLAIKMLEAWKKKDYYLLGKFLRKHYIYSKTDKKRAGDCRQDFENKIYESFELLSVKEKSCIKNEVKIKVYFNCNNNQYSEIITLGLIYESDENKNALPWHNNGNWKIYPWDIHGIVRYII